MPLLSVVPSKVHVELHPPFEALGAGLTVERFLSRVDSDVSLHVTPREEAFPAQLADERLHFPVHHLEVFGEAEAIDEPLPALGTDVDPAVSVDPAVPRQPLVVGEVLPAEQAGEGSASAVKLDVALQRRRATQDAAAFATLVLK